MPLRFGNLSSRYRPRASVDLSLHRLPDADRITLQVTVICSGEQIRMTGRARKVYAKTGDNGRTRFQHFCQECGSPLFTSGEGGPDDWGIRWGSIRQRDRLEPSRQIWCRSAAPWINGLEELPGRPTD